LTFAASAAATAVILVLAAWFTGMRQTLHSALLAIAVTAFLPFILVALVIAVGVATSFLAVLAGVLGNAASQYSVAIR
jgi:hypothetical protein